VRILINSARSFHSSVFVNGSVYLFSGSNGTEKFSDVWKFQVRETPPPLLTLAARALCTHAANQLAATNQLSSSAAVTAAVTAANQRDAARCDVPLTSTVTTVTLSTAAGPRATATTARATAVSHRHQHQPQQQQQQQLIQQHEQQQQQAVAPCAGCSYVHASKINECCAAKAALMRG
jgi:Galactose oxidase, central domain